MAEQEAVTQDATNWALARQAETAERNPEGQESAPQPEQDTHTAPAEQDAEAVDLAQQRAENGNAPHKAGVPGGVQKKIDKLTRRAKTAENELRFLKERRIQAGHGLTEADAQEIDADEWVRRERLRLEKGIALPQEATADPGSESGDQAATTEHDEPDAAVDPQEAYQERTVAVAAEHPDFNAVVARIKMSPDVGAAVEEALQGAENGADLAYHLGLHPEIVEALDKLTPEDAVAALDDLAAQIPATPPLPPPKPLTEEEITHFEKHDRFLGRLGARLIIDKDFAAAAKALDQTGASEPYIKFVGHVLADLDNGLEVFRMLAKNPDVFKSLDGTPPQQLGNVLREIAADLGNSASLESGIEARRPAASAPPPLKPVRKPAPTDRCNGDDLPVEEWLRRQQKRLKAMGRLY